jgi:hypothetical protein
MGAIRMRSARWRSQTFISLNNSDSGTFFISFMDHLKGLRTVSAGQSPTCLASYMLSNTRTILSAVLRPL